MLFCFGCTATVYDLCLFLMVDWSAFYDFDISLSSSLTLCEREAKKIDPYGPKDHRACLRHCLCFITSYMSRVLFFYFLNLINLR